MTTHYHLPSVFCLLSSALLCGGWTQYGRIESEVSALPGEKQFVASALETRVAERIPKAKGAALKVAYRLDPALGGETARVTAKAGRVEIAAARFRALYYGVARLMREMRWTETAFTLADGQWEVKPVKPIRITYWARHFHNWYHMATAAELKRYGEDMMLMGVNGFDFQYGYPTINRANSTSEEIATFTSHSRELYAYTAAMDTGYMVVGGGNQLPANSPEEFRGVPNSDPKRGNSGFNACPAKPKALAAMLKGRQRGLDTLKRNGVSPTWFLHCPFDEGGCECARCRPWGGNGFIKLSILQGQMNKRQFPIGQAIIATWCYNDEDYAGLWEYLKKPESEWVDGLLIDSHGDFPKWPLTHGIPRNLPVITFPEISMWGRHPWGGTGAIAMPARFERLFRQVEKIAKGFRSYSEGLSEDINKYVVTGLYVDPSRHWQDLVRDYARLWLPGIDEERFVELVRMMEETHVRPIMERLTEGLSDAKVAEYLPASVKMRDFSRALEAELLPSLRMSWRWRLIRLRAEIDAGLWSPAGGGSAAVLDGLREVNAIYHAETNYGDYRDNYLHHGVRAPLPNFTLRAHRDVEENFVLTYTNLTPRLQSCTTTFGRQKLAEGQCGLVKDDGSVAWGGSCKLKPGESVKIAAKIKVAPAVEPGTYRKFNIGDLIISITVLP